MMQKRLRALSEVQVRRVLDGGGMLVPAEGRWTAYRLKDARTKPAGWISELVGRRLQSEGLVVPHKAFAERLIAREATLKVPPVPAPLPASLLKHGPGRQQMSLFVELCQAPASKSGEFTQLKAAGRRFLDDIRLSTRKTRASESAGPNVGIRTPAAALGRLSRLEAEIGLRLFRQLECLIAENATASVFARISGCRIEEAPASARAALRVLAQFYNLVADASAA